MRVLLIDDHPLFREGLRLLLNTLMSDLTVLEANSCEDALTHEGDVGLNLIMLDLKLPGVRGLEAIATMKARFPEIPIVVLSGEDSPRLVRACIDEGAAGFIPKASTPDILVPALQLVLSQGIYLPPNALKAEIGDEVEVPILPSSKELQSLTPRQLDVLRLVMLGKPNKLVARELDLAESTVKTHLASAMRALGARNRTEAMYVAARMGLKIT